LYLKASGELTEPRNFEPLQSFAHPDKTPWTDEAEGVMARFWHQ
jgi:hypothetical protein